jgi:transposase InsO family protein
VKQLLAEHDEIRERRNQLQHPIYTKPELLATGPNQLWSWDTLAPALRSGASAGVTKLHGPGKWTYYYLCVILDVYSRYVVGSPGVIAERESAELAEQLIAETCAKQSIQRDQLTIHADRGSATPALAVRCKCDLQICGSALVRPRRDQNALSAARFERQSLFRGAVQDAQVSTRLSRTLRLHHQCPILGSWLLRLVQQPAHLRMHAVQVSPHGPGVVDAG